MKRFLIGAAALAFSISAQAQTPPPPPLQPSSAAVMSYCWDPVALAVAACGSGHANAVQGMPGGVPLSVIGKAGSYTIVPLDIATVTTGGVAVTALASGHRTAGGWLMNPAGGAVNLCINEVAVASGTTSAGSLTCIEPGRTYALAASPNAVSVVSSDSSHSFSGQGWQ